MPVRVWWSDPATRADRFERHMLNRATVPPPPTEPPATAAPAPNDDLSEILDRCIRAMSRLVGGYLDGSTQLEEWFQLSYDTIREAHASGYALGRNFAGNAATADEIDEVARAVADLESYYLRGFQNDLDNGRYEGKEDQARARAASYAGRVRGTANAGWVEGSPSASEFWWVDRDDPNECEDCPILAEASPYAKDNMPAVPGSNDTPCLFNCRCRLIRDDGAEGFEP